MKMEIYSTFKSYFIAIIMLGFFPFKVTFSKFKIISKINYFSVVYSCLISFIPIILATKIYLKFEHKKLKLEIELWRMLALLGCILNLIQIIIQLTHHKKIIELLNLIVEFDEKAKKLGMFVNYQKERLFVRILLSSIVSVGIIITILNYADFYVRSNGVFIYNICHTYQLMIGTFFTIQFIIFTRVIQKRLELLKDYLFSSLSMIWKNDTILNNKLQNFLQLYNQLNEITKLVNEISSSNLIITLFIILFSLTISSYSFISMLYQSSDVSILDFIMDYLWWKIHIFLTISICYSGASVSRVINNCKDIILDSISMIKNDDLNNKLQLLHYHIVHRSNLIENNYFVINWKLLMTVKINSIIFIDYSIMKIILLFFIHFL